jgi:hypothetical protein
MQSPKLVSPPVLMPSFQVRSNQTSGDLLIGIGPPEYCGPTFAPGTNPWRATVFRSSSSPLQGLVSVAIWASQVTARLGEPRLSINGPHLQTSLGYWAGMILARTQASQSGVIGADGVGLPVVAATGRRTDRTDHSRSACTG